MYDKFNQQSPRALGSSKHRPPMQTPEVTARKHLGRNPQSFLQQPFHGQFLFVGNRTVDLLLSWMC